MANLFIPTHLTRFIMPVSRRTARKSSVPWEDQNREYLSPDHDYVTELLDKLSLVRFPKGRTLLRAVELATKRVPPKQTAHLSPDVQLLACLCGVPEDRAGNKPNWSAKDTPVGHRGICTSRKRAPSVDSTEPGKLWLSAEQPGVSV